MIAVVGQLCELQEAMQAVSEATTTQQQQRDSQLTDLIDNLLSIDRELRGGGAHSIVTKQRRREKKACE